MSERISTLIREQLLIIISTLTTFLTSIATIVVSVTGYFGGGGGRGGRGGSSPKDEWVLNEWLNKLEDALKRLAEKLLRHQHRGKCCWCHFKFFVKDRWICC